MTILDNLFKVILSFVIALFNIVVSPLDMAIRTFLPYNTNDFLANINSMINSFIDFIPYIADLTFIPSPVLHFIVDYIVFRISAKFAVWSIKLVLKWWNYLH